VQCSSSPSDPSCFCRPSLQDYACHAFPDDAYVSDQVLVGLISVAIALPTRIVLEQAFLTTVEVDAEEGWMVYAGLPASPELEPAPSAARTHPAPAGAAW